MLIAFVYLGKQTYYTTADNELFANEFKKVNIDNLFVYAKGSEINNLLDNDAVILFGTSINEYSKNKTEQVALIMQEAAENVGIEKIYYYNFINDRANTSGNYELILEKLSSRLFTNDLGKKIIYSPTIVVVKNGFIIHFDDEDSLVRGDDPIDIYFNKVKQDLKRIDLENVFKQYKGINDEL
jgi:hypothetical protein